MWQKVCCNGGGANARFVILPVKFKHRIQHYFNKSTYLTFQNFVIDPFCAEQKEFIMKWMSKADE